MELSDQELEGISAGKTLARGKASRQLSQPTRRRLNLAGGGASGVTAALAPMSSSASGSAGTGADNAPGTCGPGGC